MRTLPTTRKRPVNGAVLYHGPSMLDESDIVVIVTGLASGSKNTKTGKMLQTWIMRADTEPHDAVRNGEDSSVCGACPHSGTSCYVIVERAPLQVHRAWKRGSYADWTKSLPVHALRGANFRFGSYGDPAAVPFNTWRRIFEQGLSGWTGYTHQWANPQFQRLRNYFMASADNVGELLEAHAQGWRTFRVRKAGEPKMRSEVVCPASEEAGKVTTCANCNLCQGQRLTAKSVVIEAHGFRKGAF